MVPWRILTIRGLQLALLVWLGCANLEFASNTWNLQRYGLRGRRYDSADRFARRTCEELQGTSMLRSSSFDACRQGPVSERSASREGWPPIDVRYRLDCEDQRLRGSLHEGRNFSGLCFGCINADFDIPCARPPSPELVECDVTALCIDLYLPRVYDSEWDAALKRAETHCIGSERKNLSDYEPCLRISRGSYDPRTDRFVRPALGSNGECFGGSYVTGSYYWPDEVCTRPPWCVPIHDANARSRF